MENERALPYAFQKKVQLASYLADTFTGGISIIKSIKMLFLADVYALRKYGVSITDDVYYAMKNGPVASEMSNIIEQNNEWLGTPEKIAYIQKYLQRQSGNTWSIFQSKGETDMEYLSDIDKEVLDFVIEKYREKSENELIDITHKFKVWSAKSKNLSPENKREEMDMADIFESDDEIPISQEIIEESKVLYGTV